MKKFDSTILFCFITIIGFTMFVMVLFDYNVRKTNDLREELNVIKTEVYLVNKTEKIEEVETVQEKIIRMSKEYGVDTDTALRIAECESQFGKYNHNWSGSSAQGVYQWTIGTWEWIGAEGDRLNPDDNIREFMKWYPKYPHWWDECNIIIN